MAPALTRLGIAALSLYHRAAWLRWMRSAKVRRAAAERRRFYENMWTEAAESVGASVEHVGSDTLRISYGGDRLLVRDNDTSLDDPITLKIAADKPLVAERLEAEGLDVPVYRVCRFSDYAAAREFVAALGDPVVVKPARGGYGGQGVTTSVLGRSDLVRAMARAGSHGRDVLLERQIEGCGYRLLYLDGELIDAVMRRAPRVRGDGISSVRKLIAEENAARGRRGADLSQTLLKIDRDLTATLAQQGYHLHSVPDEGTFVVLKHVVNENRLRDNRPASEDLSPSIVRDGARAARAVGLRLAGVDVMTPDPGFPLTECGGAIIEVNGSPGLYYHQRPERPSAIAETILRRLMAG